MLKNVKIDENFYLIEKSLSKNSNIVLENKKVNHIFVVDVSGSMSNDLPLIRKQLKNRLSSIMNDGDTISIIWFSGANQSGILKEEVEVKSLKTLDDLNNAIDRWLMPVGLTAFHKPLELTKEVINRIKINRPESIYSLIFLTDGGNNDCAWSQVISAVKSLENDLASSTFVEYGYYADSNKLTEMASILGGEKINTTDFDEFEPVFNRKISSPLCSSKKIEVVIDGQNKYDFGFSINNDNSILLYNVVDNKLLVNEDVSKIYYFSTDDFKSSALELNIDETNKILYSSIYVLSEKILNDDAEKIFYVLGDKYNYNQLVNAYGKQKLNQFKTQIKECVENPTKRFPLGISKIDKVDDNAFSVLNLLFELNSCEGLLFYPRHDDFKYKLIGRKKVVKGNLLSADNKKLITEALSVAEIKEIISNIEKDNTPIEFKYNDPNKGYLLSDLVWNEERANLSIRIKIDGYVELPKNKFGLDKIDTYRYKTYTIIKDGILNVSKLPVSYDAGLVGILERNGVEHNERDNGILTIDFSTLPIINRSMVKSISATDLAKSEWELYKLQSEKKAYDYFYKTLYPKNSSGFLDVMSQEAIDWLKEIGITEYNGFAPKYDSEESTDFYMSVLLATKIKGFSAIPKVEDVVTKLKENKPLKPTELVMSPFVSNYLKETTSEIYKSLSEEQQKEVLFKYLKTKTKELDVRKKEIMKVISETKFAIILSKKWFNEFKSFDENKLTLKLDDIDLDFTFDLTEKEEKI